MRNHTPHRSLRAAEAVSRWSAAFSGADEEAFMNRHILHLHRFAHRAEVRR